MKEKLILEGVLQKFDNIRNRGRIYYTKEEFDIQIKGFNERILRKKNELRKNKLNSL